MKAIRIALTNGEVIELDVDTVETISFTENEEVIIGDTTAIEEPAEEQPVIEEIAPEPERETVTVSNEEVKAIPDAPLESAELVEIPNAPVQEEVIIPVAEIPAESVKEDEEVSSVLSTIVGMATAEIPAEPTEEVKEAIPEDAPASEPVAEAPAEEVPKEEPKKEQPTIVFEGA